MKQTEIEARLRIVYEAGLGIAFPHCSEAGAVPILHLDIKR